MTVEADFEWGSLSVSDEELAKLRETVDNLLDAIEPFAKVLHSYGKFDKHQLILLSEDNPKNRRLAHLFPENFKNAENVYRKMKGHQNETDLQ